MKLKSLRLLVMAALVAGTVSSAFAADSKVIPFSDPVNGQLSGAAAYPAEHASTSSIYNPVLDFYNGGYDKSVVLIKHFKTYQQTSEISCGPATALMVLNHYGVTAGENQLAKEMDIRGPENRRVDGSYGASMAGMAKVFRDRGFTVQTAHDTAGEDGYSFADINAFKDFVLKNLKEGNPVMVENIEWGGHWFAIIGYDDMGTATPIADTLIVADPYDTSDQHQDGYYVMNAYRFFSEWFDNSVLPANERIQPYVVVTKTPSRVTVTGDFQVAVQSKVTMK